MYLGRIVEIGEAKEVFHHPAAPVYAGADLMQCRCRIRQRKRKQRSLLAGEIGSSAESALPGCRFHPQMSVCDGGMLQQADAGAAVRSESRKADHYAACPAARKIRGTKEEGAGTCDKYIIKADPDRHPGSDRNHDHRLCDHVHGGQPACRCCRDPEFPRRQLRQRRSPSVWINRFMCSILSGLGQLLAWKYGLFDQVLSAGQRDDR